MRWDNIAFCLPTHSQLFPRHPLKRNQQVHLQYFSRKGDKESNQYSQQQLVCLTALLDYVSSLTSTNKQVHKPFKTIVPMKLPPSTSTKQRKSPVSAERQFHTFILVKYKAQAKIGRLFLSPCVRW